SSGADQARAPRHAARPTAGAAIQTKRINRTPRHTGVIIVQPQARLAQAGQFHQSLSCYPSWRGMLAQNAQTARKNAALARSFYVAGSGQALRAQPACRIDRPPIATDLNIQFRR